MPILKPFAAARFVRVRGNIKQKPKSDINAMSEPSTSTPPAAPATGTASAPPSPPAPAPSVTTPPSAPAPAVKPANTGDLKKADLKPAPKPAPAAAKPAAPKRSPDEQRDRDKAAERAKADKAAGKTENDSPFKLYGLPIDSDQQPDLHKVWLAHFRAA